MITWKEITSNRKAQPAKTVTSWRKTITHS